MSSGKKVKKSKGKTVPLNDFLASGSNENPGQHTIRTLNWADDVEDDYDGYMSKTFKEPITLPTAPRAARDPDLNEENVPTKPPFTVYLTNLPFDSNQEDLAEFFQNLKVANIQIPTSDGSKSKGYGYVEFEDRQSLIEALKMSNMSIKNRRVKIEVSNSANDDRRGRMNRDNRRDDRYGDPDRTSGDWRSGPREELPYEGDRYRSRGFDSRRDDRDRDRDGSSMRPGAWRESSGPDRGRSSFRDRGSDKEREWSHDRERGSAFGPRRNYGDSDRERPSVNADSEPRMRPKLKLEPRTKPIEPIAVKASEEKKEEVKEAKPKPTPVPSVNIFGAAKPVDTAAREREIEERLSKAEMKYKDENDGESRESRGERREVYRAPREGGTWNRRNGENRDDKNRDDKNRDDKSRDDKDRDRKRTDTWRSDDDRSRSYEKSSSATRSSTSREYRGEGRGPPPSRSYVAPASRSSTRSNDSRPPVERERRTTEKDEDITKMPKAKEEEAPNFVASNKYSMLQDDVEPDNDVE